MGDQSPLPARFRARSRPGAAGQRGQGYQEEETGG